MSESIVIAPQEHGIVRVFAVNLPDAEVAALLRSAPPPEAAPGDLPQTPAAAELLGLSGLDTRHTELFAIRDLTGLGLGGYLTEGLGLKEAQVAADRARLAALDGHVLIVLSRAFQGQGAVLPPSPKLTLIGSYREDAAPVIYEPLPSQAARGVTGGAPIAPAAATQGRSLRIASLAALILALLAIAGVAVLKGNAP